MGKNKRFIMKVVSILLLVTLITPICGVQRNVYASSDSNTKVIIDPSIQYQTMDGWGTNLAWWAAQVGGWSENIITELEDLIFGEEGLDFNMIRYNIGGGENPNCTSGNNHMLEGREMEGFQPSKDVWDWNADANQRRILMDTKNKYDVNFFEANSNTPPHWMTVSGCAAGSVNGTDDNLASDQYDNFTNYITEVVKHFRDEWGITFTSLVPINEPVSGYWKKGGTQEGCQFNVPAQKIIINKVADSLKDKGLSETKVAASDETSVDHAFATYSTFDSTTKNNVARINTHTYTGTKRFNLRDLVLSDDKKLWMTEFSTGYVAHSHEGIAPALPLANTILKDVKDMGSSAWMIWQAVESEAANLYNEKTGQAWNPGGSWGLIHGVYSDFTFNNKSYEKENYWVTKQYYVMKQFSKFIKQGSIIIDSDNPNVLAAHEPVSGNTVLVVINNDSSSKSYEFSLDAFDVVGNNVSVHRTSETEACEKLSDITVVNNRLINIVPAKSVTTYVIPNSKYLGAIVKRINDQQKGSTVNKINYSGANWGYWNQTADSYSLDHSFSKTANESFSTVFNGTQVKWYGSKNSNQGLADIYVDGKFIKTLDTYSSTKQDGLLLYKSDKLPEGQHTFKVVVKGTKNPSSSEAWVSIDMLEVTTDNTFTVPEHALTISSTTHQGENQSIMDLGGVYQVKGINYIPKQNEAITQFSVEISLDGVHYTHAKTGTWSNDNTEKTALFNNIPIRYVKLTALSDVGDFTSAEKVSVIHGNDYQPLTNYVNNSDFDAEEQTQTPSNWLEWNDLDASYTQPGGHSGKHEGVHWSGSDYDVATYQKITGLENGKYTLSAWVKSSGGHDFTYMEAKEFNASNTSKSTSIPTTSKFTKISVTDIIVENGECVINFRTKGNPGKWIVFDDISLKKVD